MAGKKKVPVSGKYVYKFTAEHGPEDFPTLNLGRTLEKKGELIELDSPVDHARLQLVSGPEEKKDEPTKTAEVKPDQTEVK